MVMLQQNRLDRPVRTVAKDAALADYYTKNKKMKKALQVDGYVNV
jgi:hypothetical protein